MSNAVGPANATAPIEGGNSTISGSGSAMPSQTMGGDAMRQAIMIGRVLAVDDWVLML